MYDVKRSPHYQSTKVNVSSRLYTAHYFCIRAMWTLLSISSKWFFQFVSENITISRHFIRISSIVLLQFWSWVLEVYIKKFKRNHATNTKLFKIRQIFMQVDRSMWKQLKEIGQPITETHTKTCTCSTQTCTSVADKRQKHESNMILGRVIL